MIRKLTEKRVLVCGDCKQKHIIELTSEINKAIIKYEPWKKEFDGIDLEIVIEALIKAREPYVKELEKLLSEERN